MTDITYHARSWDELLHDVRTKPTNKGWKRCDSKGKDSPEWYGSASLDEAIKLAEQGVPALREELYQTAARQKMEAAPMWDIAPVGVFPCIPAHAAGIPEDMFMPIDDGMSAPKPIIRIYMNVSAGAHTSSTQIMNRGAAIVNLIDSIEGDGLRRVELVAVCNSANRSGGNKRNLFSVVVKRPEEDLDWGRVSFALAHPSFLRRLMFRVQEIVSPYYDECYGMPTNYKDAYPEADVFIPSIKDERELHDTKESSIKRINQLWQEVAA
jgi:hypothetical protein